MKKKKQNKKEHYVRVCPKCHSTETTLYKDGGIASTGMLPDSFQCLKCGFVGRLFPEIKTEKVNELEVKKPTTEYKKADVSYGNFYVRGLWKISGPLTILVGIVLIIIDNDLWPITLFLVAIGLITTYFAYRKRSKE